MLPEAISFHPSEYISCQQNATRIYRSVPKKWATFLEYNFSQFAKSKKTPQKWQNYCNNKLFLYK